MLLAPAVRNHTTETRPYSIGGLLILSVAFALGSSQALAQPGNDMQALKKDVEALKAGQKEIQKNLRIVKDILMGKQPPLENVFVTTTGAPALGEKDAKVTMIEFSDYQCPFCGRYATQTMSQVLDEYVKSGKVRYIFRNFPLEQLHPMAAKAAEAALCADEQGKYWEAHDRFFKNQQALDAKEMQGHAVVLGLDAAKFQQCVDGGKYTAQVKNDVVEGSQLGVKGTPTFFFGLTDPKDPAKLRAVKLLSGAVPFANFKEAIDNLLNPPKESTGGAGE